MPAKLMTIRLECPTCRTSVAYARRAAADPPRALWALLACPGCDPAGTATPTYYDEAGRPIRAAPPDASAGVTVTAEVAASAPAASLAVTAFVPAAAIIPAAAAGWAGGFPAGADGRA